MLKYILLGFLDYGPMTGYELKSIMDKSTMHFWHAYHSQIYTTLRKLEEASLVESELDDDDDRLNRRRYTLTAAGQADLMAWLRAPMTDVVSVKEELLIRLFFSANRDRQGVIAELRFQRQLHQRKLETYVHLSEHPVPDVVETEPERFAAHRPFWAATLRFGIEYEKLYLAWLDETIEMLKPSKD